MLDVTIDDDDDAAICLFQVVMPFDLFRIAMVSTASM